MKVSQTEHTVQGKVFSGFQHSCPETYAHSSQPGKLASHVHGKKRDVLGSWFSNNGPLKNDPVIFECV